MTFVTSHSSLTRACRKPPQARLPAYAVAWPVPDSSVRKAKTVQRVRPSRPSTVPAHGIPSGTRVLPSRRANPSRTVRAPRAPVTVTVISPGQTPSRVSTGFWACAALLSASAATHAATSNARMENIGLPRFPGHSRTICLSPWTATVRGRGLKPRPILTHVCAAHDAESPEWRMFRCKHGSFLELAAITGQMTSEYPPPVGGRSSHCTFGRL